MLHGLAVPACCADDAGRARSGPALRCDALPLRCTAAPWRLLRVGLGGAAAPNLGTSGDGGGGGGDDALASLDGADLALARAAKALCFGPGLVNER